LAQESVGLLAGSNTGKTDS